MMEWLKKLRTSRGFGVHSPFAFSLITDTLRMPSHYAYYAYDGLPDPTQRLIYRVAARLGVGSIVSPAGNPIPPYEGIGSARLYIFYPSASAKELTLPELYEGDAIILIDPEDSMRQSMLGKLDVKGCGMSFTAHRAWFSSASSPKPYALFCFSAKLPRQDFEFYV